MNRSLKRRSLRLLVSTAVCGLTTLSAFAKPPALPSSADALKLAPIQQEVDYDRPTAADAEKCKVEVDTTGGAKSYVVIGSGGEALRRFVDSNSDNKVDMWCYFRDGVEVYRDLDTDGNGKADQYRWLGVAGTRWGIDDDEDTKINSWKQISAEEVTEEVVAALRTKDLARFKRVLLTSDEAKSLVLEKDRAADLARILVDAVGDFPDVAKRQKVVVPATKWVSFGGGKPGVFAVSSESQPDVIVYDNVAAVIENEGKHGQVAIGSMVRVGHGWRVIDAPRNVIDETNATPVVGWFFQGPPMKTEESGAVADNVGVSPALQKLVGELERVDKDLANTSKKGKLSKLNAERADVIERIIDNSKGEDRETWLRQYAETLSAAVQSGTYPEGVERLKAYASKLAHQGDQDDLSAFFGYRALQSDYNVSLQTAREAQIPKIHAAWVEGLEQLVAKYKKAPDVAEPMLALAQEYEISGKDKEAIAEYSQIAASFPTSDFAKKGLGAKRRLESIGSKWMVSGNSIDKKQPLNPAALAGKVVVVQYWASWCNQCIDDFSTLKSLQAKYGKQIQVIGVNLDSNADDGLKVLKGTSLSWPTLHESGGFDSRFANEMGIFTLPLMVLVDRQGKVVSRNITAGELDVEIRKLLK